MDGLFCDLSAYICIVFLDDVFGYSGLLCIGVLQIFKQPKVREVGHANCVKITINSHLPY